MNSTSFTAKRQKKTKKKHLGAKPEEALVFGNTAAPKFTPYVASPGVRMIAFHLNYAYTYVHTYTSRDIMDIRMHIRIRHRMIAFHLNRVEGLWFRFRV